MPASELPYALHGLLIAAALLLWFHLGWKRYVIERGRDDIQMLRNAWWDLVISNPEWRQNAACRAFTRLLEGLAESLPKYSLGLAVTIWLTGFRPKGSNGNDVVIGALPDAQLQAHARVILDAALLAVMTTMLRQSPFVLSSALLVVPVGLIAMLAVTVVRHGLPGLAPLPIAVAREMRGLLRPALLCALVVGAALSARESGTITTQPGLSK
jgi:hypothetical protein